MDKQEARQLTEREKGLCRELWEEIFTEDSSRFLDYYDNYKASENECYGIFDGGRLVSMLELNPYKVSVHGHRVGSRYIIAVATRPEYRHRGFMARLLKKSLEAMREAELPFLYLMPAAEAIYYPFGFRYFYAMNTGSLALKARETEGEMVRAAELAPGAEFSARLASAEDIRAAEEFSRKVLSVRFDFYTVRDLHYYETLLAELESESGGLLLIEEGAALKGLVPFWGGAETEIREVLCLPEDGAAVLEAAGAYFLDRESFSGGAGDGLPEWEEPEAREACKAAGGGETERRLPVAGAAFPLEGKKPIIMGRLCHAERFLELFSADRPVEIELHLNDELLEENSGVYLWRLSPEGSRAEKLAAAEGILADKSAAEFKDRPVRCSVSCTAAELFSWLAGGQRRDFPEEVQVCKAPFINEIV